MGLAQSLASRVNAIDPYEFTGFITKKWTDAIDPSIFY